MGVDLSITSAVGIILNRPAFEAWAKEIDPDDEYYAEDYLIEAFRESERDGISFGTAGSYYVREENNQYYLYLNRLSTVGYVDDMPGGIMGKPSNKELQAVDSVTPEEENRLVAIADTMGTKYPVVEQFTAVLWWRS